MKRANLYEATEVLLRARDVILQDHPLDKRPHTSISLDTILLEHDKPKAEIFPSKNSMKPVSPRIRGDTSIREVERMITEREEAI